jgi:hypothetical protein
MQLRRFGLAVGARPRPGLDDIQLATCDFQSGEWEVRACLVLRPSGCLELRFPQRVKPTPALYCQMLKTSEAAFELTTGEGSKPPAP